MKLRDGDISWHDFLEQVKSYKYVCFFVYSFTILNILCINSCMGKVVEWVMMSIWITAVYIRSVSFSRPNKLSEQD